MADKRGRAGNAHLKTALLDFKELSIGLNVAKKEKVALKCLRDAFSENLKISTSSTADGDRLSHTVNFSVLNNRHEDTLVEITVNESTLELKATAPSVLASQTIHRIAVNLALELLGFDLTSEPSEEPQRPKVASTEQGAIVSIAEGEADEPKPTIKPEPEIKPDPVAEIEVTHEVGLEATVEVSLPDSIDEVQKVSHSSELANLIRDNKVFTEEVNPSDKLITHKGIAKIVNYMRDVNLSQAAIISRLRNTSATNISEMTMGESHRIANWLKKESKDSSAVISKREKFGGFDVNELNSTQSKVNKRKPKAPKKSVQEKVLPVEKASPVNEQDVLRAVKHYEKELEANPEVAAELATEVLTGLTGNVSDHDDIPDAIGLLEKSDLKKFRSNFAKALFNVK